MRTVLSFAIAAATVFALALVTPTAHAHAHHAQEFSSRDKGARGSPFPDLTALETRDVIMELDQFLQGTQGMGMVGAYAQPQYYAQPGFANPQIIGALPQIVGAQGAPAQGVNTVPERLQRVMAGIPQASLAAAGNVDSQITVSEAFRPDRIILDTASWALNVTNVRIGTKSLNVTSNPLAGECFARDSVGGYLQGYTAQPGVGFIISFSNPTAGALTPRGGIIGPGTN